MRVVFDTNVLVAAFATEGLCSNLLRRANQKDFVLYISPFILHELQKILRTKLSLSRDEIKETTILLREIVTLIDPERIGIKVKGVCRDRNDDFILACALACSGDYIVTGDQDLLILGKYKSTKIITPRDFELLFA